MGIFGGPIGGLYSVHAERDVPGENALTLTLSRRERGLYVEDRAMEPAKTPGEFETRYEYLRPAQLIERRKACPLVIVPVGPLEYHGPHLPIGVDAINCTRVAHACCRRLGRGVVLPTMFMGTERERPPEMLEALGFEPTSYVVGMDFPSRLWNSHYLPEEVFAIRLRAELNVLIGQGYRYILIANGHGAQNHMEAINRLCIELSNTTPAKAIFRLTLAKRVLAGNWAAGHADSIETSMIMHYGRDLVDLGALPPPEVPIHSWEFSVVDGLGFTQQYHADRVVRNDPRNSTQDEGRQLYDETLDELVAAAEELMS